MLSESSSLQKKRNLNIQKFVRHFFGHTGKYQVMATGSNRGYCGNNYPNDSSSGISANSNEVIIIDTCLCILY